MSRSNPTPAVSTAAASASTAQKAAGWGIAAKRERERAKAEAAQVIKSDNNDPFVYKPKKAPPTPVISQQTPLATPPSSRTSSQPSSSPLSPDTTLASPPSTNHISTPSQHLTYTTIHSVLIDLYEIINLKPKSMGQKKLMIVRENEDSSQFHLHISTPSRTTRDHTLLLEPDFEFVILPDRYASFVDDLNKRFFSVKFDTHDDLSSFIRYLALVRDFMYTQMYEQGGIRKLVTQDVIVGSSDGIEVTVGSLVKLSYSIYVTSSPYTPGEKIAFKDITKRFAVGQGTQLASIELGIVGMRKRGVRVIVVPPLLSSEATEWGPHIPPETTLLVEVTLTGVRNKTTSIDESPSPHTGTSTPITEMDHDNDNKLTLSERMMKLATIDHPGAKMVLSNDTQRTNNTTPHRVSTGNKNDTPQRSLDSATTTPRTVSHEAPTRNDPLEMLLNELQMIDVLPRLRTEGVQYADLFVLDGEELKQLIPQMGPRRRLQTKLQELKSHPTTSTTTTSTATPTPTTTTPTPNPATTSTPASLDTPEPRSRDAPQSRSTSRTNGHHTPSLSPTPVTHTRSPSPSPPITPSVSQADLSAAYDRGKSETIELAREKLETIKIQAQTKMEAIMNELEQQRAALQAERDHHTEDVNKAKDVINKLRGQVQVLTNERDQHTEDVNKVKDVINKLRGQVQVLTNERDTAFARISALSDEKDALFEKSKSYIQATRSAAKDVAIDVLKSTMDVVYSNMLKQIQLKNFYDGQQVLDLVKSTLKNATLETLKQHQLDSK